MKTGVSLDIDWLYSRWRKCSSCPLEDVQCLRCDTQEEKIG
jgi:hypothetical protein